MGLFLWPPQRCSEAWWKACLLPLADITFLLLHPQPYLLPASGTNLCAFPPLVFPLLLCIFLGWAFSPPPPLLPGWGMGRNFWVRLRLGELQPASGPCSSARAWLWGSHIRYQKCPSSMWNSDHLQCSLAFHILPRASTLATWCEEPIHWKRPWCWERLKAGGEGGDRGWDGWMVSLTQWTWVWTDSGRWWRTGKSGVLQSTGLQRVGHYWVTKQLLPGLLSSRQGLKLGLFLLEI